MSNKATLLSDIVMASSDLRIQIRRQKTQTQEIQDKLKHLPPTPKMAKVYELCERILADLNDAQVRADAILASNLLEGSMQV